MARISRNEGGDGAQNKICENLRVLRRNESTIKSRERRRDSRKEKETDQSVQR